MPLRGTGVLVRSRIFENGFSWLNLTEDNEFTAHLISKGYRTTYCEAAKHFDEQPLSFRILARQQMRWARGSTLVFFKKLPSLLFGIVTPTGRKSRGGILSGVQKRFSCFDRILATFPLWAFTLVYGFLYPMVVFGFSAITGSTTAIFEMLITVLAFYTIIYVNFFVFNFVTVLREGHQMRIAPVKLFLHMFLWPFVYIAIMYVWLVGIFWPVKWKPIPHVINKQIEDVYKEDTLANFR